MMTVNFLEGDIMTRRVSLVVAVVAAVALSTASIALPQEPAPPQATDLAVSMAELNASMKQIASLLREHLDKQEADLLMKRMEFSSRALASQEQLLRSAVNDRDGLVQEMKELQLRLDQIQAESDRAPGAGARPSEDEFRRMSMEFELRQGLYKEQLAAAEQKVMELENDVMKYRDEIRIWQELVDARLGLR